MFSAYRNQQLICRANQLTGLCMIATLVVIWLTYLPIQIFVLIGIFFLLIMIFCNFILSFLLHSFNYFWLAMRKMESLTKRDRQLTRLVLINNFLKPISWYWSLSIPPENIRKRMIF